MNRVFLLLSAVSLLSACGNKSDQFDPNAYPYNQVPTENQNNSKQLLAEATVYCNDTNCPGAVGMIAMGTSTMAGSCSGFLISPTLALTNSHCVPNEVRTHAESAVSSMRILFPATTVYANESSTIAEVIFFSQINPEDSQHVVGKLPDYALLRLSTPITDRGTYDLSREGVPDNLPLTAYTITPTSQYQIEGSLAGHQCRSLMNSVEQPSYTDAFTSVISFTDCEIKHGNSGSPLVDAQGKVRAILQASIDKAALDEIAADYGVQSDDFLNLATNISCLDLPGVQSPANSGCSVAIPQIELMDGIQNSISNGESDPTQLAFAKKDLQTQFDTWQTQTAPSNGAPFQWKLTQLASGDFMPTPKCYTTAKKLQASYTFSAPTWKQKATFDSTFRFALKYVSSPSDIEIVYVNSKQTNATTPVDLQYTNYVDHDVLKSVPRCAH